MHEAGETEEMLRIVLDEASKAGITKITKIDLAVGDLSHIATDSVTLYFEHFSKGTAADGAELTFRQMEGAQDRHDFRIDSIEGD
jgi:Zn finger protein HypA/HybF involved in hydrogenase expression